MATDTGFRTIFAGGSALGVEPADLLARFVARGDEAAFATLVARHGPMVRATCQRILTDGADADDAFQATFLVLARRAGSVRSDRLAPWLHGVARRVAARSRSQAARRRGREGGKLIDVAAAPRTGADSDLRAVLDEELARLPGKYRVPLVLCYLEGMTHDEAADQLGWPVGSVRSRLARGRDRLRGGMARRGFAPGALAVLSPATLPVAVVSHSLQAETMRLVLLPADRVARTATGALAQGTLTSMFTTQLQTITAVVAASLAIATAGAVTAGPGRAEAPARPAASLVATPQPPSEPNQTGVDPGKFSTKTWDLADFTQVEIQSAFRAEIRQGDRFEVVTTVEESIADLVQVERDTKTLRVKLAPGRSIHVEKPLQVRITLPKLEGVSLSGAAQATLVGEPTMDRLRVRLAGASRLDGTIRAEQVDLGASAAASLILHGAANSAEIKGDGGAQLELADLTLGSCKAQLAGASHAEVRVQSAAPVELTLAGGSKLGGTVEARILQLQVSGASRVKLTGKATSLSLEASGAAEVNLHELPVATGKVNLSGASTATVHTSGQLDYNLSSASSLKSIGKPAEVHGKTSSGARFLPES